jgi:hypothetical protein
MIDADGAVRRAIDERGKRYGSLLVIQRAPGHGGGAKWHCRCEACGRTAIVRGDNLRSGRTKSCGCAGIGKGVPPKLEMKLPAPKPQPRPNRMTVRTVSVETSSPPPLPEPPWRVALREALARAFAELGL